MKTGNDASETLLTEVSRLRAQIKKQKAAIEHVLSDMDFFNACIQRAVIDLKVMLTGRISE